jgi:hypothetical protein
MLVIRISYTIVKPTAMMVEAVSTPITRSTVLGFLINDVGLANLAEKLPLLLYHRRVFLLPLNVRISWVRDSSDKARQHSSKECDGIDYQASLIDARKSPCFVKFEVLISKKVKDSALKDSIGP